MRILNVTAQKPNSTGSGIFLSELMKEFANKGHTQALVAGVYPEEETPVPEYDTRDGSGIQRKFFETAG